MKQTAVWTLAGACAIFFVGLWPTEASAQSKPEVKAKPPMYSYIANWEVPRTKFKEIETVMARNNAIMKKGIADGSLVGFGTDITLIHQDGESTHDNWWSSMSWAGLMKTLDALKADSASEAVLASGKHNDKVYVSRYYNWRPGSFTNGYTRVATWKLKSTSSHEAVDQSAKSFAVPMFEKLLADGAIYEYEIDEEAVHTADPATFMIIYVANGPDGLDKAAAALSEFSSSVPFAMSSFSSSVESSAHRDGIYHTTATYK